MIAQGLQTDQQALLVELETAGAVVKGQNIKCPFHDDRNPSGGIYKAKDGIWRFKCHAADCGFLGDMYDVRAKATGRPLGEILTAVGRPELKPQQPQAPPKRYPSLDALIADFPSATVYQYTNPDTGKHDLVVLRYQSDGRKKFAQAHQNNTGYILGAGLGERPLYNRTRMQAATKVVVVEGEKCVHALQNLDYVATTSPGGAKSARKADWGALAGKTVYLWPDNDDGGRAYMNDVADILQRTAKKVIRLDVDSLSLPAGGDVVDYLETLGDDRLDSRQIAIQAVLEDGQELNGQGLQRRIREIVDGERDTISLPWEGLDYWSEALCAGSVTVVCGVAGAAKSFWLLQLMAYAQHIGRKVALFELEEDADYHLHRLLAQLDRNSHLANVKWVKSHGQEALEANDRHGDRIDALRSCLWDAPERQVGYDELLVWIEKQAKAGAELIAVDPITAVESNDKPWRADLEFVMAAKTLMRKYKSRLILITHPRTGIGSAMSLESLAGGAAFRRFPQTVLWIKKLDEFVEKPVQSKMGTLPTDFNVEICVCKARNGPGTGLRLAYTFSPDTLGFNEHGVIRKQ